MKKHLICLILIMISAAAVSQTARDYFPQNEGHKWYFNVTPLDSLNNPITGLEFVRLDSFATTGLYQGKNAEIVVSKTGDESIINLLPYTDTSYYSFEGNTGWSYYSMGGLDSVVSGLDSGFAQLLKSFENWYSIYRFSQGVNTNYDVFSFDTVVVFQSTPLQMRFKLEGRRFADETLNTAIGTFTTKKFRITSKIIYLFLGIIPITIVERGDTNWIAQDNWILKSLAPSSNVDLSFISGPSFFIPGTRYDIAEQTLTNTADFNLSPGEYSLKQNYPNPFNPETKITYTIPLSAGALFTTLKIFDVLGREIITLVNETKQPGVYEVKFNASNLPGGVYYYRLNTPGFSETKKMVYLR